MSFNFPNTPTDGQTFQPITGGPTYAWNAATGAWKLSAGSAGGGAGGGLYVGDTPPTNQVPGMLWWESDTGNLYVWYADPDSSQWVMVVPGTAGTPPVAGDLDMTGHNILNVANINGKPPVTARRGNRVVNGNVSISQENGNTAGTTVANYYPADQWYTGGGVFGAYTIQRVQVPTPAGASDRLRWTITTGAAAAANSNMNFQTKIEGLNVADLQWGTATAVQAVIRFMWRSPAGTYTLGLRNNNSDRAYLAPFTVSAAQANVDTIQTFVVPGDVTGTWAKDNTIGILITIGFVAVGTALGVPGWQAGSFVGLPGIASATTTGQIFDLGDVGLYADPDNTGLPPPWEVPDYVTELNKCLRYYFKNQGAVGPTCNPRNCTDGFRFASGFYTAPMRVNPAVTATGILNYAGGQLTMTVSGNSVTYEAYYDTGAVANTFVMQNFVANARM
jgi:hypothetical protein